MKKFYIFLTLFAMTLGVCCGCTKKAPPPSMKDYSLALPEGYSAAYPSEDCCDFVRDEDGTTVGGLLITQLRKKDLSSKGTSKIMKYLQEEIHKTNNVEFIAFAGGGDDPKVGVTLTRNDDVTGEQRHFYHHFFEKEGYVYHLWFDKDVLSDEMEEQITDQVMSSFETVPKTQSSFVDSLKEVIPEAVVLQELTGDIDGGQ